MNRPSSRFRQLSIKSRLVATVAVLVVVSLAVVSTFNFLSLQSTTRASVNASAQSLALARAEGIGQWVASKAAVVGALLPATQVEDPMPALTQAVKSGFFDTTYIGYQNKKAIFSTPQNLPPRLGPDRTAVVHPGREGARGGADRTVCGCGQQEAGHDLRGG